MSKITLTYFDAPGRAEPIRVALFTAGIAFEDKRLKGPEWGAAKATTPGGSLPIIEIDGKVYTQSLAIARWAGRKSTIYPKDEFEALRCDEILDIAGEIMSKVPNDKDEAKKKALREEYAAGILKFKLDFLESYAPADGFMCGKDVTLADLNIASMVAMVQSGNLDHIAPTYIDQFPKLVAVAKRTGESEVMKKYTASKK